MTAKNAAKPTVQYLSNQQTDILMEQPDISTPKGRRDLAMILLLYDSAARVQELCDLRICDIRIDSLPVVHLLGKGRKSRDVPLPIPDPVSDYERKQYPNLRDYINAEIIPEMQKKLRQGFGRAIRTEQDSCVVAVLDERAGIGGKYYEAVLAALPTCPTTEKIEDVHAIHPGAEAPGLLFVREGFVMNLMRNHDVWIYVRCANSDPRIAFDRLYDLIDEAAGHGFLVRGTSFDHCSGNTLKDRIGLRTMLDAVENNRIEAVIVRDLEQISRNSYILVGVIEILRQNDVYLITTECDLNTELINSGLERFVGDRFTRASFGKPRFDVRLPLMDQF